MIVLDTNVISELMRQRPDQAVPPGCGAAARHVVYNGR